MANGVTCYMSGKISHRLCGSGWVLGVLAAIGQAAGVLFLRPVMEAGMDPLMVSLVRVAVGAMIFWAILPFDPARKQAMLIPDSKTGWMIIANGFFGLSFGVALLLQAFKTGNVADVTILSATSPVLILPFVWYQTGKCPPLPHGQGHVWWC